MTNITKKEILKLNPNDYVIIDVRNPIEFKMGNIEKSINIPYDIIEHEIGKLIKDKKIKIILYCRSGNRSSIAMNKLNKMGYKNVNNLGAITNWF